MEETKIETVNEATSDNVEEVKEAPKRRGRKPKVESTEEVKLENTVQEVQPEFTVEEFIEGKEYVRNNIKESWPNLNSVNLMSDNIITIKLSEEIDY